MGIQKSFVIKNGIEVNSNLIFGDAVSDRVGIGTTAPLHTLHVNGGIGATDITVSDDLNILGKVSIGGTYGNNGSFLISTGAGVSWSSLPQFRQVQTYTATTGQTVFGFSYSPVGGIDVYINGVRLSPSEYTATNGSTIILDDPCFGEETVDLIAYSVSSLGTGVTGITGLTILDEGTTVGNGGNVVSINFVGAYVTTAPTTTGFGVTVYVSEPTPPLTYWSSTAAGINTLSNVGVGTTNPTSKLTVQGNASISGIVTASGGFISVGNTTPIQISVVGNQLTFTAVGIGSTTLTLF